MSIKMNSAREGIRELNENFQGRAVAPEGFYSELERFGVDIKSSVLVSIVPDSGTTYIGYIINQNANVCSYDIDYESKQYSTFEVEGETNFKPPQHTREKPWDIKVVALELFNEKHS